MRISLPRTPQGKTTLLVSVICQYLMESDMENPRRLMVCAPTNKAVSLLASRFLAAMNQDRCKFKPIMVGDADKLLDEEQLTKYNYNNKSQQHHHHHHRHHQYSGSGSSNSADNDSIPLRSIFVFSWMLTILDDYRNIRNHFTAHTSNMRGGQATKQDLYKQAVRLEKRLTNHLPGLPDALQKGAAKVCACLKTISSGGGGAGADIVSVISKLVQGLEGVQTEHPDTIWRQLLASADVIFCTLASSGGVILKNTPRIHDLIVDEAAAATEPELCIPFHLRPTRLLCVGDPLQLPATVLSRRAISLGLAQSLHERLMFSCNYDYIMLDVNYRMNPAISAFPSARFYNSKIANGPNVTDPHRRQGGSCLLLDQQPYIFLNIQGNEEQAMGGSYRNTAEARCIVDLVMQLQAHSQSFYGGGAPWYSTDKIRIITFYQAQVALVKRMLRERHLGDNVVVATVDSSQGCEADIVLVSFVRSRVLKEHFSNSSKSATSLATQDGRRTAGFLMDDRRMNVALTRARFQLICIGNVNGMARMAGAETLQLLASDATERGVIHQESSSFSNNNVRPRDKVVNQRLDSFYGSSESAAAEAAAAKKSRRFY
jgi:AAA domain